VGAAALTGRLPQLRRAAAERAEAERLAFHRSGGPLVAVCGLAGGAGTSTLAYLLARRAARHSSVPVLLAELDAATGLAALAGAASPLGLRELAVAVDEGRAPDPPFAEAAGGLRLIATTKPDDSDAVPPEPLARLLEDARTAHGLVVIDAGQPTPGNTVLTRADQALLCLPATKAGTRRAELQLTAGLLRGLAAGARSALVCSATQPRARAQVRQLRRLAQDRVDRLLLVPHVPQLAAGKLDEPAFESTLTELATLLRSPR